MLEIVRVSLYWVYLLDYTLDYVRAHSIAFGHICSHSITLIRIRSRLFRFQSHSFRFHFAFGRFQSHSVAIRSLSFRFQVVDSGSHPSP